jgi:hypothetical protein
VTAEHVGERAGLGVAGAGVDVAVGRRGGRDEPMTGAAEQASQLDEGQVCG